MQRVWRSWLYVPATRPDRIEKALAGPADCVVIDLEDAVVPERKDEARSIAADLVGSPTPKPVVVRVNGLRGPWGWDDLAAVASPHVAGIRLPKVSEPALVQQAGGALRSSGCPARLYLLLESALGVEQAYDLARADERVAGIGLGEDDLRANLRADADEGLWYARSRIVTAARAAGLPPPVQSVYPRLDDDEGLEQSTRQGRGLGFFGRSLIHPSQVPIVHRVFTPAPEEVAAARALVDALTAAAEQGSAALMLPGGRFVDPAVAEAARWTLAVSGDQPGDES